MSGATSLTRTSMIGTSFAQIRRAVTPLISNLLAFGITRSRVGGTTTSRRRSDGQNTLLEAPLSKCLPYAVRQDGTACSYWDSLGRILTSSELVSEGRRSELQSLEKYLRYSRSATNSSYASYRFAG